jgi:hypothetical protein
MGYKPNKIIIKDNYAIIVSNNSDDEILIDLEDVEKISPYSWSINFEGYAKARIGKSTLLMHRFIIKPKKSETIDHINRNKIDNRKYNLNIVNNKMQNQNRGLHKSNTSGFSGVSFNNQTQKWCVSIYINGIRKSLGSFVDKNEAIKVRKEAEREYYYKFENERN